MTDQELLAQGYVALPMLPLRGLHVFPGMMLTFDVERPASITALERAVKNNQVIFLTAQKDLTADMPQEDELYRIGTVCRIRQQLRQPRGNVCRVMVEGVFRAAAGSLNTDPKGYTAIVTPLEDKKERVSPARREALLRSCLAQFDEYIKYEPEMPNEQILNLLANPEPIYVSNYIAQNVHFSIEDKQAILEELYPTRRLALINKLLNHELDILSIEKELNDSALESMARNQREYYLREEMKAIQSELGEDDDIEQYRVKIQALPVSDEIREKLLKELGRLQKQPFGSSEAAVLRNYLDVCLEIPWGKTTKETVNIAKARKKLDDDHFGLDKVKERVLEYLAVKQLSPDIKGGLICLVGPPGVGKTSIARSIARALGRKFVRMSLGGVKDEAEVRGHRRTYVGAMPGRILYAMKNAGSVNPVFLLDEIDKISSDMRGDPSSALLEVLDPEQNSTFRDRYLEVPYDLSKVLFITTANTLDTIPGPLRDRMEMINIAGYLMEEKVRIALDHLLPKQRAAHGIGEEQLTLTPEVVECIVAGYTREAGVRSLDKHLAKIARARAKQIAFGERFEPALAAADVEKILGMPKFLREEYEVADMVGVVTGLAWTEVGGDILYVESVLTPGKGKLSLTGNLGDVMKESATIAHEWVMAHHKELGIDPAMFAENDIDIHVPEGAIPKDGPSAGITMVTSIVSTYTGRKVKERIAMTGETTLRGRVMPVGGVKEKILAAKRAGITELILSEDNRKDIAEIKPEYIAGLTFHYVRNNSDVLRLALQ